MVSSFIIKPFFFPYWTCNFSSIMLSSDCCINCFSVCLIPSELDSSIRFKIRATLFLTVLKVMISLLTLATTLSTIDPNTGPARTKIEQVIISDPEDSWQHHEDLLQNCIDLWDSLGLHYEVVNICTGDMGTVAARKYDHMEPAFSSPWPKQPYLYTVRK